MSKTLELKIEDITKGWSPTEYLSAEGQYLSSIGIDPEAPRIDGGTKPSGVIRPTAYEKFSGANVNSHVIKWITQSKTNKVYAILANGKIIQYDADLTNETLVATVAGGVAEGAEYYNDYIYITTPTDVSRFGSLSSGSPTLTDNYWTSTLSKTALVNNTYPSIHASSGKYPQHWMNYHRADNKLYFLDYKNGKGLIHYIKTTYDGNNDNSTYDAFDLPFGLMPTCKASLGLDTVIGCIQTTDGSVNQGKSSVIFWDAVSTNFDREVPIPGILTALFNVKGILFAISGSISGKGGHTLYYYAGENTFKEVCVIPEGYPPLAGAVDAIGNRLIWGSHTSDPENACHLLSWGSKDGVLPNALHSIARSTLTCASTDGVITAIKHALQGTFAQPTLLIAGKNQTSLQFYCEKPSTTYQVSYFRSKVFNIGNNFNILEVKLHLGAALAANMSIVPKLYIDNKIKTSTLPTIDNTRPANLNQPIAPTESANGESNFFLELKFAGTVLLPVLLPIVIKLEIQDD